VKLEFVEEVICGKRVGNTKARQNTEFIIINLTIRLASSKYIGGMRGPQKINLPPYKLYYFCLKNMSFIAFFQVFINVYQIIAIVCLMKS
jgi:hypothetical protein